MKYRRSLPKFSYNNSNQAEFILAPLGRLGGNIMNGLNALSIPLSVASLAIPDATTRSVNKMRKEDKEREKKGLPPLPSSPMAGGSELPTFDVPQPQTRSNPRTNTRVTTLNDPKYVQ